MIGVGGDTIEYRDKRLTVNGKPWTQVPDGTYSYLEGLRFETLERAVEQTDGDPSRAHRSPQPAAPPVFKQNVRPFPHRDNCDYNDRGFSARCRPGIT